MVHKRLFDKYKFEFISNRNLRLSNGHKIRRDIPRLKVIEKESEIIKYIFLGVHLKSQRRGDSGSNGMDVREMEIELLDYYIKAVEDKYKAPVFVGGDFNIDFTSDEKYNFYNNMINFHDLKKSTIEDRCSHIFFGTHRVLNQMDYLLTRKCNKELINIEESYNYRYFNEYGDNMGLADSFYERSLYPSEHYPVIIKLK